jgi:sulfopyruvate decarboxylase TPP-binding subunit
MRFKVIAREATSATMRLKERSARIIEALHGIGTTHAVGLPDNMTSVIFELLSSDPYIQLIPVCREGEAWAIASGLWVGGKFPIVIMQSTGFLESGDALRGTAVEMGVPLVALMDYRGHQSLGREGADSAATYFEPTLRAWEVPYFLLEDGDEERTIKKAQRRAHAIERPVGVILR